MRPVRDLGSDPNVGATPLVKRGCEVELRDLVNGLSGDVVLPDDEAWDAARQAWNLAVDQRPVAVVYPESAEDVAATVRFAAANGLRIAFNAGGHNAGPIDWSRDTLLLKTERMRGIEIDVAGRRARVEAGVLAKPLATAAGEHGLAYLAGTSPDVGVVGYALGGGLSWMVRTHGLACNSIVAADVVTADGRLVRTDHDHEPELFWALRGGGGNVAAVTAIELALVPVPEIYAGALFWPIERASEILRAWRDWIETVPDACESLGRMLQLPDVPFLPDAVRGQSFVLVEAAFIGSRGGRRRTPPAASRPRSVDGYRRPHADERAERREHGSRLPAAVLRRRALPDGPADGRRSTAWSRRSSAPRCSMSRSAISAARPPTRSPDHGVLDAIDQPFVAFTFGLTPDAEVLAAVDGHVRGVLDALGPWDSGRRYLNFAESAMDPRLDLPARRATSGSCEPRLGTTRPACSSRTTRSRPRRRAVSPAGPCRRRPTRARPCCA